MTMVIMVVHRSVRHGLYAQHTVLDKPIRGLQLVGIRYLCLLHRLIHHRGPLVGVREPLAFIWHHIDVSRRKRSRGIAAHPLVYTVCRRAGIVVLPLRERVRCRMECYDIEFPFVRLLQVLRQLRGRRTVHTAEARELQQHMTARTRMAIHRLIPLFVRYQFTSRQTQRRQYYVYIIFHFSIFNC